MEFFRAGEALIRSSQPLLLPFLTPTAYQPAGRIGAASRRYRSQQWQCQHSRTFTSSQLQCQQPSAAASPVSELSNTIATKPERGRDYMAELLDSADPPTGRTSRSASNTAQKIQSPQSSVDQLMDDFMGNTSTSSRGPSSQNSPARSNPQVDQVFSNMLSGKPPPSSADEITGDVEAMLNLGGSFLTNPAPEAKKLEGTNTPAGFKLDSTTGRVINVDPDRGIDAARAFRMLGGRISQNNVKRDFQMQRFHERPGLKRKRLKSQRWRKRFREAFQHTVSRVIGMKRQGW